MTATCLVLGWNVLWAGCAEAGWGTLWRVGLAGEQIEGTGAAIGLVAHQPMVSWVFGDWPAEGEAVQGPLRWLTGTKLKPLLAHGGIHGLALMAWRSWLVA